MLFPFKPRGSLHSLRGTPGRILGLQGDARWLTEACSMISPSCIITHYSISSWSIDVPNYVPVIHYIHPIFLFRDSLSGMITTRQAPVIMMRRRTSEPFLTATTSCWKTVTMWQNVRQDLGNPGLGGKPWWKAVTYGIPRSLSSTIHVTVQIVQRPCLHRSLVSTTPTWENMSHHESLSLLSFWVSNTDITHHNPTFPRVFSRQMCFFFWVGIPQKSW